MTVQHLYTDGQPIRVGDVVTRSSRGKQWVITELPEPDDRYQTVRLKPVEGYTRASHPIAAGLTLIARQEATA